MTHDALGATHEPQGSVRRGMERMEAEIQDEQDRAKSAEFWKVRATQLEAIAKALYEGAADFCGDYNFGPPGTLTEAMDAYREALPNG